jgi:segregation and condensation protein A
MDYQVDLDIFRGPLDLLLFLVKRDEVDIFDIPIARITEQYVQYLEVLKLIDIDRVGEFLVMASTLMEIKSRMLLPRGEEEAAEESDPRLELVRQLIEYKRFKEASALLEAQAERQAVRHPRHVWEKPRGGPDLAAQPLQPVELWDLVSAFGRLLRETLAAQPQQIAVDDTPTSVYMERIRERLSASPRLPFSQLFEPPFTRYRLLGWFLALLEMMKQLEVVAEQEGAFAEIWLSRRPPD